MRIPARLLTPMLTLPLALAPACAKNEEKRAPQPASAPAPGAPKPTESSTPAAAIKPLEGPLTAAAIMGTAALKLNPFHEWEPAERSLRTALGEPTWVDGETLHWAVVDGDTCTYTHLKKEDRSAYFTNEAPGKKMVGTYQPPQQEKNGDYNWDTCVQSTGKAPAAPANGAPSPAAPAGGSAPPAKH